MEYKNIEDKKKIPTIEFLVDFESIKITELISLLSSIRLIIARSFVEYFYSRSGKEPKWQAYMDMECSYIKHYQRYRKEDPVCWEFSSDSSRSGRKVSRPFWNAFDYEVFDDWIKQRLNYRDIQIIGTKSGSITLVFSIVALLGLTGISYDYSLLKDITTYIVNIIREKSKIGNGFRNDYDFIPEIIRILSSDNRVTKLQMSSGKETIDLKIEWESPESVE